MYFFFFYIFNASRRSLASTPTPIRFVLDAVSRQVKWPEREADYSLSYRAEVKNEWNYTSISSYAFTARKWKTSPLTLAYMVKKLPAFSGTRRPYLGVLYWVSWIQSTPSYPISLEAVLVLLHLHQCLPSDITSHCPFLISPMCIATPIQLFLIVSP